MGAKPEKNTESELIKISKEIKQVIDEVSEETSNIMKRFEAEAERYIRRKSKSVLR